MIFGISGKRGVGKTTLANYLVRHHGFVKVSLAGPIREIAQTLLPFERTDFTDPNRKEKPWGEYEWTPRDFLLHLGEFMRYHVPDYWLNIALDQCSKPGVHYVFDDMRFPNEAEAIKKTGGKLIRLNRQEKLNPYGKNLDIASETALDDYKFDFVIDDCRNTKLSELYTQGDVLCQELL